MLEKPRSGPGAPAPLQSSLSVAFESCFPPFPTELKGAGGQVTAAATGTKPHPREAEASGRRPAQALSPLARKLFPPGL